MSKKSVIQDHHICYSPEIEARVYQGEHWLLTLLNRRKRVSRGFIVSLKVWIVLHEGTAIDLRQLKKKEKGKKG